MRHNLLSILARNQPDVLVKVATVISGRGLNIHELTAKASGDPAQTIIFVDFLSDAEMLRLIIGQLEKLEVVETVDVINNFENNEQEE